VGKEEVEEVKDLYKVLRNFFAGAEGDRIYRRQ
jgi:hypothetical protein